MYIIDDKNIYEDNKQQIQIVLTFGARKKMIWETYEGRTNCSCKRRARLRAKVQVKFKIVIYMIC